ncbi:MAG: YraN family protein [Clostridiales bacterium]|jgi:putative endonuclease|nr:YraN family protein [Clostridiales bacterium]
MPLPNHEKGAFGQKLAEDYLTAEGHVILARNFRCPLGEIDLISRDQEYIVFIEIKYRRTLARGYPREAVGPGKRRTISRVAQYYIVRCGLENQDYRFDVVEILGEMNPHAQITHIENAF